MFLIDIYGLFLFGLVKYIFAYQNLKSTCPKGYQGFRNFASPELSAQHELCNIVLFRPISGVFGFSYVQLNTGSLPDTFWGHLKLILHLVKRGIISAL